METIFAVCTYNRKGRLPSVLAAMRAQETEVDYEILVIDNNSTDGTAALVADIASQPGRPIRYVFEPQQGITFARNRAIEEALHHRHLIFIDDDEIPHPGLLRAAVDGLGREGADCVGGRVRVVLPSARPRWFHDDLFGFLAAVDHGETSFWIKDRSTPVWTANIGYRMEIFRRDPELRFDRRYNRQGHDVGGGSDAVMFWRLLEGGLQIRYRPDMIVDHHVEAWRMRPRYFVKLHYRGGLRHGQFRAPPAAGQICGVPRFLVKQALGQSAKAAWLAATRDPYAVRQAMNAAYTVGDIQGRFRRWRQGEPS